MYRNEAAAARRAERLRDQLGIWPGVVRVRGGWRLTFDPADAWRER